MELVFDLLMILLPSVVVFFTAYLVIKTYLEEDRQKKALDLRSMNQKSVTPVRLQAYERLILLMERLSPNSLIMRVNKSGMTAADLRAGLLNEIRAEFDHNLSQQLYISKEAWNLVRNAKEETVKLINLSYSKVKTDSNALDLSKAIFDHYMQLEYSPTRKVINYLKDEARELF